MHKSIESRLAGEYLPQNIKSALLDISALAANSDRPIFDPRALLSLAETADLLPLARQIGNRDLVYRVRRLVFSKDYRVIGNEPTEESECLNATRDFEAAEFYAKSYGDELAPADLRIDPVIITFDVKELTRKMTDQGLRWRIPKSFLAKCNIGLFSVERSITAERFLKSIQR